MTHRGKQQADHRVEGISVFVRVRPTSEQEGAGENSQQVGENSMKNKGEDRVAR